MPEQFIHNVQPVESKAPIETKSTPKKKNNTGKIVGIVVGVILLLCSTVGLGFYLLFSSIQNGPQATAVRNMWEGLDTANEQLVRENTSETVFTALYFKDDTGVSAANIIKGSILTVKVSNVSTQNGKTAEVYYTINAEENSKIINAINYAELEKVNEKWIVTYYGTKEPPASTFDDDDFDY